MEGKSIPERVHDLYYRMFPGADCPVTGAEAREKLMAASRARQQQEAGCSSEPGENSRQKYKHPHVYDVYGRRIDEQAQRESQVWKMPAFLYYSALYMPHPEEINPANRMPKHANQQPAPGQTEPLSTHRQRSTIPKGGTEETWLYPSSQMFYNSLVRKNKADDVTERDMDVVVATHNTVNETTWARLLQWEQMYARLYPDSEHEEPRLLHFKGRPNDLSPKAQCKRLLGYGVPFDRHDWIVDRGGREMRYVIDFYYDDNASENKRWPFFIDVRPAVDSPSALLLRARMLLHEMVGSSSLQPNAQRNTAEPQQPSPAA